MPDSEFCKRLELPVEILSPFPTLGGPLSSLLQPLSGPSRSFVPLGGYLFAFSCSSWIPFVDIFFPFLPFLVALHGLLSSLFQSLGVPLPINLFAFSCPLADPSRASSNPLVALRRSSCPLVDIFLPFRALRGSPSWISFSPSCLSSWPFTDSFRVFSNPLESLCRLIFLPFRAPWRIPLEPSPTP